MPWLTVAGGVFLVWLVLVFLFPPGINDHFLQDDERDLADSVAVTLEKWERRLSGSSSSPLSGFWSGSCE